MTSPTTWVVDLADPAAADLASAGGKAVGLHALLAAGLPAPPGFCVTTAAFLAAGAADRTFAALLADLDACPADDLAALRRRAAALREHVSRLPLSGALVAAVAAALQRHGEHAYAVRSSASAEDLDDASFAGLQDSFLQVRGAEAVTDRVRACWASLFTDRAVAYRRRRGIAAADAAMAVVVQRMIAADAAGVIFSADPTTGHRGVAVIEAVWGLGEALVGGHAPADVIKVRRDDGAVLERRVADKRRAILGLPGGGTREQDVPEDRRRVSVLSDAEARALAVLAARAEALRGAPQDVEWARQHGALYLLQSRAITTLFPQIGSDDGRRHVYLSFGHVQVNLAPLSRFGMSVIRRLIPFGRRRGASRYVRDAGGRLFADLTPILQRAPLSVIIPAVLGHMHRPSAERLAAVRSRPDVVAAARAMRPTLLEMARFMAPVLARTVRRSLMAPERMRALLVGIYDDLVARQKAAVAAAPDSPARLRVLQRELADEFDVMMRRAVMPLIAAMFLGERVLRRMCARVCPEAAPDALLRGLEGNITTEMDLELGDLADLARDHAGLVAAVRGADPVAFAAQRGPAAAPFFAGWDRFLARYGSRCAGEIDVAVPRWRERPDALLRALAGLLDRPVGAHRAQHEAARREAERVAAVVESAARRGPLGWLRGPLIRGLIDRVRTAHALREHHKFALIELFGLLHAAAREVGDALVADGGAADPDDVFLLDLDEVLAAADAHARGASLAHLGQPLAAARRLAAQHAALTPPSLVTDEGEVPPLPVAAELPAGTLRGVAVSSGVIEGRARVIRDPARETLAAGEVLVAPFTDPGWTPLFMHAAALVMEVGGLMTHGSVVAREIGIPAVVAVDDATRKIRDGQRIRVDGDRGWVTLLADEEGA